MWNISSWVAVAAAVLAGPHLRVAAGVAVVECSPAPDSP
jgi:hypothetical protein